MTHALRSATASDRAALEALISRSVRILGAGDYTPEQLEFVPMSKRVDDR